MFPEDNQIILPSPEPPAAEDICVIRLEDRAFNMHCVTCKKLSRRRYWAASKRAEYAACSLDCMRKMLASDPPCEQIHYGKLYLALVVVIAVVVLVLAILGRNA
jgi:hypothetical protein